MLIVVSQLSAYNEKKVFIFQADPTANLTFNLTLRPEEKAAKDQVVLPYTSV